MATSITQVDQESLNTEGINAIRSFGAQGIRIWGARTLSSNPLWRDINVRRLVDMIEQTIREQTQWVVFEPNDMALWERVGRTISGFLHGLWRDGALVGATAEEVFFVRCDAELNPLANRHLGFLITEVAIAPVGPAEFVVFRLSQTTRRGEAPERSMIRTRSDPVDGSHARSASAARSGDI